jgi:hypothetical protein
LSSVFITKRPARSGVRYVVRFRLGGRAWPLQHGGSFRTLKEARVRRDLIAGEIAAGRNPADVLHAVEQPRRRTLAQWADAYEASRIDLAEETRKNLSSHLRVILPTFRSGLLV